MKTPRRDSSPYSSVASASVPIDVTLQSALGVHTKLLVSDLDCMTSSQMEYAIKPLREVANSLQGWMVHIGSFLERAEATLQRFPLAQAPVVDSSVGFMDEVVAKLFGSFSPRVGSSLTPLVLQDSVGEASVEVVSSVLQIMPELQVLCGEDVSPASMEQLKLGSLQASKVDHVSSPPPVEPCQASDVDLVPSPPPVEPCQGSDNLPLSIVEHGVFDVAALPSSTTAGQVMPLSGMTIEPLVLAPTPNLNDLFVKEI
ncbi:unnamed protein product [Triticum turgidum subsp. durum]|uniref:Uncharacterized protein n=1 Tax=Triticum turgidum subsp. durum TaxID=4567 RepID=A0A9R0T8D6_TRITD|nr:unnamed protein product [Triticum turgidum subsp. durum]